MDELITPAAAAAILGASRAKVHVLIETGRLEGLQQPTKGGSGARPSRIFVRRSEVERLAQQGWRQRRRPGEARAGE
jgi:hypothetical protein